jgi:hypothetical protein
MPQSIINFIDSINWKVLFPILKIIWNILSIWGWVILAFLLWKPFKHFWLYWREEQWWNKQKHVLFEIKIPKEVLKPIRAMEVVLSGLWQILYSPPNWYEKWIDGQDDLSYSFEIVSLGGEPHFYIRAPEKLRDVIEANVYSQYPEAEISIAEDYAKYVPQDIPNKDWDLWGADYVLAKPSPYPILTYKKFETESEAMEEKRIDPVAGLLESMAKINPGEQLWVQIKACPLSQEFINPFLDEAKALRDKLAKRPTPTKSKSMAGEAFEFLAFGKVPEEEQKKEELIPPEMKLTPGEKDIIMAVEEKMAKPLFRANMRFIYLGKKEVFFKPNARLGFNFFAYFTTVNCNSLIPFGKTMTKIKQNWYDFFFFIPRRLFLRKRKLFRNYKERVPPFYPRPGGTFWLNIEEVASLFHFPSSIVAPTPTMSRVESKRGGPPSELPVE